MKKRLYLLLSLWTVAFAWHFRFHPTRAGSPIPATFGVNQDWTRHNIVQTGSISSFEPWTLISSYMGAQNYDFGSILLAIVNIVTGKTGLVEGLNLLNALQISGLILFPLAFLYWYQKSNMGEMRIRSAYLVLVVALFPTHQTLFRSSTGWNTSLFATAVMLFIIVLLTRAMISRRILAIVLLIVVLMMNLYHTWVFIFLCIISSIYVFDLLSSYMSDNIKRERFSTGIILIVGIVFFIIGYYYNNRVDELVRGLSKIFAGVSRKGVTANSELLTASGTEALFNLNLRRIFKLINTISAMLIVGLYSSLRFFGLLNDSHSVLNDTYERVLIGSILIFPLFIIVFYNYGGLGSAIGRTRYIGIYFAIFAAALLLKSSKFGVTQTVTVLIVIVAISSVPATVLSGGLTPIHTTEEQHAIVTTGTHIPEKSYVFSDSSLGPPMGYYNVRGVAIVMTTHTNWSSRMRSIYFQSNPTNAIDSVHNTIDESRLSEKAPQVRDYYIFLSEAPKREGVGLLSVRTVATGVDPRDKFDNALNTDKLYTSGENTLYQYKNSSNS